MKRFGPELYVGDVADGKLSQQPQAKSTPPAKSKAAEPSGAKHAATAAVDVYRGQFGEQVPFGDPAWYQNWVRVSEILVTAGNMTDGC